MKYRRQPFGMKNASGKNQQQGNRRPYNKRRIIANKHSTALDLPNQVWRHHVKNHLENPGKTYESGIKHP